MPIRGPKMERGSERWRAAPKMERGSERWRAGAGPMRGLTIALLLAATLCGVDTATADDKTERADALFNEGKALFDKDLAGACAKFQESLKFNSQAIGTLLNVALCDEKLGRFATALAEFTEARDRAQEQGMSVHLKAAEEHMQGLAGKVPHVTLKFGVPPLPETTIVIDEKLIPFDSIANHPIDPGKHDVVVSATGHLPFKSRVNLLEGEEKDVMIPQLQRSVTVKVKSSQRTIGKIVTTTGIAAIGTGVVLGLVAKRNYDSATESCNRITVDGSKVWQCDATGFADTSNARTLGMTGTVVGVVGIAAVGVGVFLWLRSPKDEHDNRVSVLPQVGPEGAGLVALGHF